MFCRAGGEIVCLEYALFVESDICVKSLMV